MPARANVFPGAVALRTKRGAGVLYGVGATLTKRCAVF